VKEIKFLKDEEGRKVETHRIFVILSLIILQLFTGNGGNYGVVPNKVNTKNSDEDNLILMRPFSIEEFKEG